MLINFNGLSAQTADDITGTWISKDKETRIQVFKAGSTYAGKIVWMKDPYEKDGKTLRKDATGKTAILNSVFLYGFSFQENVWKDGKIYDPESGKTYKGLIRVEGKTLELRGYMGIEALGKSVYWQKVEQD